jgi:endogenous inhibitor of DNA gyrase (YacG/DUF329 family)
MISPPRAKPCPICGRPSDPALAPFCSGRCADIDLHRWLAGVYAVPASESEDAEAADVTGIGAGTKRP